MKYRFVRRAMAAALLVCGAASVHANTWHINPPASAWAGGQPACARDLSGWGGASCLLPLADGNFERGERGAWTAFDTEGYGGKLVQQRKDGSGYAALLPSPGTGVTQFVPLPRNPGSVAGKGATYALSFRLTSQAGDGVPLHVRLHLADMDGQPYKTILDSTRPFSEGDSRFTVRVRDELPEEGELIVEFVRGEGAQTDIPLHVDDVGIMLFAP